MCILALPSGKYAVGAFNVYDLVGAAAVVEAAEATGSPAMLQIHPGSLRGPGGGAPFVEGNSLQPLPHSA